MGAADVVPGVSGGTVAFITGIYEELIDSIKSINPTALKILYKDGVAACWASINGSFLAVLLLGIMTSVISLAQVITYLLEAHPLIVWSFFLGLIAASSIHMIKQINTWNVSVVIVLVLGVAAAYGVAEIRPSEVAPTLPIFFGAGCIAICAMILPGISGSFILLLIGMYSHVLTALKDFQLLPVLVFAAGCGTGLLGFSQVLSWMFKRYHDRTMALLTGFLIGSLNLVWPWKQTLSYYQNSSGEQLPLQQSNVWPWAYQSISGFESNVLQCVLFVVVGLFVVYLLEKIGSTQK
jgi:putative membrane protein